METITSYAKRMGLTYATAYRRIRKLHIPVVDGRSIPKTERSRRCKLTEEEERRVAEMYESGDSLTQVGQLFGIDRITVHNILKRLGVPRRLRNGRTALQLPKQSHDILYDAYVVQKLSLWQIAEKYGYPNGASVSRDMKYYGIDTRSYSEAGKARELTTGSLSACGRKNTRALIESVINRIPNNLERAAIKWLESNNIKYIFQYRLDNSECLHFYDFYLPELNAILEMDGVYWHEGMEQRDGYFNRMAWNAGKEIIRITDKELKEKGEVIFHERLDKFIRR